MPSFQLLASSCHTSQKQFLILLHNFSAEALRSLQADSCKLSHWLLKLMHLQQIVQGAAATKSTLHEYLLCGTCRWCVLSPCAQENVLPPQNARTLCPRRHHECSAKRIQQDSTAEPTQTSPCHALLFMAARTHASHFSDVGSASCPGENIQQLTANSHVLAMLMRNHKVIKCF